MKGYRITKIIYAQDLATAINNERKAEIVEITTTEAVEKPSGTVGFSK